MSGPFRTRETSFRTLKDECRTLADNGFKVRQGPKLSPLLILPIVPSQEVRKASLDFTALVPYSPSSAKVNMTRTYHEQKDDFGLWHPRMAHVNPRMALIAKPDLKNWLRKCHCDSCTLGKFHRHLTLAQGPKLLTYR